MLAIFNELRRIDKELSEKKALLYIDYRIVLRLNMSINLYIASDTEIDIQKHIDFGNLDIDVEYISLSDKEDDSYYSAIFKDEKTLNFGLRRSLNNIIDNFPSESNNLGCPIVSFYSYKGGVGRTTSMALFASYYATHHGKKVFIIDCDFDAPGLINFYDISNIDSPKNGLVEYINDKAANLNGALSDGYVYQVSSEYSGEDGTLHLLSAGNIFNTEDRQDYLEGLGRLDIHGTSVMVEQFKEVISDIKAQYNPDVILIDSRTGFNDIFGIIANQLSSVVVGFFGINDQTKPGLHFFMETVLKRNLRPIFVLSILSSSISRKTLDFKQEIDSYIQEIITDDMGLPNYNLFSLGRYPLLEDVGTKYADKADFIDIINRKMFSDYVELFEAIASDASEFVSSGTDKTLDIVLPEHSKSKLKSKSELKESILEKISNNFPKLYADEAKFSSDYLEKQFYYRTCMEDIFNPDKFILLGGKGTGKTAFYKALQDDVFFRNLKQKRQENKKFTTVHVVSIPGESECNRFIEAEKFTHLTLDNYYRFWMVYTWLSIRLHKDKLSVYQCDNELGDFPIYNTQETVTKMERLMQDDNIFQKIENDLIQLDAHLKKKEQYLLLVFDQLDKVVKPSNWSEGIPSLIRYAQQNNFSHLHFKLFIRRDLFAKLTNLNNKQALSSKTINLEWQQEELYAFWFKFVFSQCKTEFFEYAKKVNNLSIWQEIDRKLGKPNRYNQIHPSEKPYLLHFVQVFFGENADKEKRYGNMYDWLYKNLQNADGTVNLRPFIDMMRFAIKKQQEADYLKGHDYPILSPEAFKSEVRRDAVEGHLGDLMCDSGNEALKFIIEDIKDNRIDKLLKISPMLQNNFEKLLNKVKENHLDKLKDYSLQALEDALVLNGIVFVRPISGGLRKYTFAYLYKYYLGLSSPRRS